MVNETYIKNLIEEGNYHYRNGDDEKAIKIYEKVLDINPNEEVAWNNIGNVYFRQKRHELAINTYKKSIELNVNYLPAWCNLGGVYNEICDYSRAIEAFQKTLELDPEYIEAWFHLGNAYYGMSDFKNAIEAFERTLRINPDSIRALDNIGITYLIIEEYDKAIEAFEQIIKKDPNYLQAWKGLFNCYEKKGNDEITREIKNIIESFESNLKDMFKEDLIKRYLDNFTKDEIEKSVFDIEEEIEYCYFLLNSNQINKAIDFCRQILTIDPENYDAKLILPRALIKKGDYEEALEIYFEHLRNNPDDHYTMINISKIYDLMEDYDLSLEWAEKAIDIFPETYEAYFYQGNAFFSKGEYEEAIYAYLIALDSRVKEESIILGNLSDNQIWKKLSQVYYRNGDYKDALDAIYHYIGSIPDESSVDEAITKLREKITSKIKK